MMYEFAIVILIFYCWNYILSYILAPSFFVPSFFVPSFFVPSFFAPSFFVPSFFAPSYYYRSGVYLTTVETYKNLYLDKTIINKMILVVYDNIYSVLFKNFSPEL